MAVEFAQVVAGGEQGPLAARVSQPACRLDDLVVAEPARADQELSTGLLSELGGGFQVRIRGVPASARACLGARPVLRRACSIIG